MGSAMRLVFLALTAFATVSLALVSTAHAETAIATKWRIVGEAQNDCMNKAAAVIERAGFGRASAGSQSMSGKKGDFTVAIRCISEQRIVFFVSSGPSPADTSKNLDALYASF